jgi:hypothetical protein
VQVAAGITNRLQSGSVVTQLTPLNRTTVTATSVTGNVYAGCFDDGGLLVDGSERFLEQRKVGYDTLEIGSKFSSGFAEIPAGATRARTWVSFSALLWSYQGGIPVTCAAGQTPQFSRFQATSVRTTRWDGAIGSQGAQLASVSTPVDTDLNIQP